MGLVESLVIEALGEKGAKAYVPMGLLTISLGSLLYSVWFVDLWANNLLFSSLTFLLGLILVVASDTNLAREFLGSFDFEKLGKSWAETMSSVHEILTGSRSLVGDVISAEDKKRIARRFFPLVVLRLGGFYLTSLSLLFSVNVVVGLSGSNFLQSLGASRLGFSVLFFSLACAGGLIISPLGETKETGSGSSLPDLGLQVLGSYFLENVKETSPSVGLVYRALVPMVAIQMVTKGKPLHTFAGFYQFERVAEILDAEVTAGDLVPIGDSLNLIKSVGEKGSYQFTERGVSRPIELQDLDDVEPDSFIAALLSGKQVRNGVNCRFRPKTKNGLFAIAAIRGCVTKFREIRVDVNKVYIKEESIPRTIFYILGVGDKSTMTDFELKFTLKAKKQPESELTPCRSR